MKNTLKILALMIQIPILLCTHFSTVWATDALKVMVSIVPQKYFVEKIGGDRVAVSVMVLPGANPATYEPRPRQMVALIQSEMYFAMGVPFEEIWLEKFADVNPNMRIVHTEDGIEKIPMMNWFHHEEKGAFCEAEGHSHHGTEDPHIWLSPSLVQIQSRNIFEAFLHVDPGNRDQYMANYNAFVKELGDLDRRIRDIFKGKGEGAAFMVYHPSWGYFARPYGLEQIPIEIEGKEPKGRQLQHLIEMSSKERVNAIFVQPQFSSKSANTIAKAVGCQIIIADPLAENWHENLLAVAQKFRAALSVYSPATQTESPQSQE